MPRVPKKAELRAVSSSGGEKPEVGGNREVESGGGIEAKLDIIIELLRFMSIALYASNYQSSRAELEIDEHIDMIRRMFSHAGNVSEYAGNPRIEAG